MHDDLSTEDELRKAIDLTTEPQALRDAMLIYADWLDDVNNPLAVGYRIMAKLGKQPEFVQEMDSIANVYYFYVWYRSSKPEKHVLPEPVFRRYNPRQSGYGSDTAILAFDGAAQAYAEALAAGEIDEDGVVVE